MRGGHIIQQPEEEELLVEAEVRESQIACPTGWFPSKISTMLAININTNSMPNSMPNSEEVPLLKKPIEH